MPTNSLLFHEKHHLHIHPLFARLAVGERCLTGDAFFVPALGFRVVGYCLQVGFVVAAGVFPIAEQVFLPLELGCIDREVSDVGVT